MNLVYLSPVPFASFAQRSHKFIEWFLKENGRDRNHGGRVLWIEPYPTRLPQLKDLKRPTDIPEATEPRQMPEAGRIEVLAPRALPIEPLPLSGFINGVFWKNIENEIEKLKKSGPTILGVAKPSELAVRLLERGGFATTFYDAMDDFPAFYSGLSRSSMARRERKVAELTKLVFGSSTELVSRWQERKPKLIANACDTRTLPDFDPLLQKPSSLVYIGTIGEWFDWDFVIAIAEARPTVQICLIGPVFNPAPRTLPKNIELRPACAHRDAMMMLKNFKTGLIPFKINRLTQSVDPIKFYEYRGMGLSLISSAFGEMRFRAEKPGVFLLDRSANFDKIGAVVDAALSYMTTPDEVAGFRTLNSWEERFGATQLLS